MSTSLKRQQGNSPALTDLPVMVATTATAKMEKKALKIAMSSQKVIDSGAAGKEIITAAAAAGQDLLAVIARIIDRPFLSAKASEKLRRIGRMLTPEAVGTIPRGNPLLDDLNSALRRAEAALDDVECQHICLQGLIMSGVDGKKNLVSKICLDVKRSRVKKHIEKRREKVDRIIGKAHSECVSVMYGC